MVDYEKLANEAYEGVDESYAESVGIFTIAEKQIEDNTMPPELIATHVANVLAAVKKKQSGAEAAAVAKMVIGEAVKLL